MDRGKESEGGRQSEREKIDLLVQIHSPNARVLKLRAGSSIHAPHMSSRYSTT